MNGFAVETRDADDDRVIALSGEVDVYSVPGMREAVLDAVAALNGQRVVLDVRDVRFIDSTGLALLISARRYVDERGGTIVLRNPSEWIVKVLDISGLRRMFEIERTL
jgi:anti-anti-sigma factor